MQVVNFHPKAVHSLYVQEGEEDGSEHTIRSPLPTFHLLREADVLSAVAGPVPLSSSSSQATKGAAASFAELVPSRNAAALRQLGPTECGRRFKSLWRGVSEG